MIVKDTIEAALSKVVNNGELAGAATLISRGRSVQVACAGVRDLASHLPVERDTIFRIASMSKPVTSTVALMLFEEGRFSLEDPITRFAPEFEHMRVLLSPEASLEDSCAAERQITFKDLLTHRAGLTYSDLHRGPIRKAYDDVLGRAIDNELTPDEWMERLAQLPLIDQPGAGFHYGHSTDLLGFLVARMDDAPLGDVLQRRIFGPLGMKDTGFSVPREKRIRRAGLCGFDAEGRLLALQAVPGGHALPERPEEIFCFRGAGAVVDAGRLSGFRTHVRDRRNGRRRAAAKTGDFADDGFEPTDCQSAGVCNDVWTSSVCGRSRLRLRRRRGDRTRESGSHAMWRWCGRGRLAGRIRRMVAGGPKRWIRDDLPGTQHGRIAPDGGRYRSFSLGCDIRVSSFGYGGPGGSLIPSGAHQLGRSLKPRPSRIMGTHRCARTALVWACFAPEM
jgi:CubicO group peptidase (beta-lactamase class C family)